MVITVISDASFRDGRGGYAAWAKSSDGVVKHAGASISWVVSGPNEAELIGLCEGIQMAIDEFQPAPYTYLLVQSDSVAALGALLNYGKAKQRCAVILAKGGDAVIHPAPSNDVGKAFAQRICRLIGARKLSLYLKHVKGHSGKTDGRSRVNQWCDREAGKHQRSATPYRPTTTIASQENEPCASAV